MSNIDDDEFVEGEEIQEQQTQPVKQVQEMDDDDEEEIIIVEEQKQDQQQIQEKHEVVIQKEEEQFEIQENQEIKNNVDKQENEIDQEDDFIEGEEIQVEQVQQEQQIQNQNDDFSEEEEIIIEDPEIEKGQVLDEFVKGEPINEIDQHDDEFVEGEEIKHDEFVEGEEIKHDEFVEGEEIKHDEFVEGEEIKNDDEFEEGEIVEHQDDSKTKLSQLNKSQLTTLFSEICQSFSCSLGREFDIDSVPGQEFYPIEVNLDKNSVNYLLEREQQNKDILQTPSKQNNEGGVSQDLKNAFLEQIRVYTLVWTKYQPYIQMSDQYNFVIEYPSFEAYDISADPSPKPKGSNVSAFPIPEPVRPGLQEILDLIPDYSKLLEQTFEQ